MFKVQAVRTPSDFAFRRLSGLMRNRIYFLASLGAKESTLVFVDVDDDSRYDAAFMWNPLIESSFQVLTNL